MAALALKDAGIEVIAVGNGEAAVRKIPEVLPDLVLADIFMPVRNGYEVCEFVKHDPRFANIPVLLLAGAFDPFDEQEAQRVHADGVLKKPFVPPDPLINAVKTLLAKSAGDRLMAVTVPAEAEAATAESGRATVVAPPRFEAADEPSFEAPEEFALPLTSDNLDTKEKPAAFASTLQPPPAEIDEVEPVVTASRDPSLGEPAFWVPAEESEEHEDSSSDDGDLTDHSWGGDGRSVPLRDDPVPVEKAAATTELEDHSPIFSEAVPLDLVQDVIEPAVAAAPPAPLAPPAPAASAAPVLPASDPIADSTSAKDRSAEDTVPLPETWVDSSALELEPLDSSSLNEPAGTPLSSTAPTALPALTAALPAPLPSELPTVAAVPASVASQQTPHENEMPIVELAEPHEKWAELLEATHAPKAESAPEKEASKSEAEAKSQEPLATLEPASHQEPEAAPETTEAAPKSGFAIDWPPAFIPAVSAAVNDARASAIEIVHAAHTTPEAPESKSDAGPLAIPSLNAGVASLSPAAMEAAIQRVMERMQPQIMELVTRDILRPLVEALVQQELKK
jgi:CheY-like chemotaxis protein